MKHALSRYIHPIQAVPLLIVACALAGKFQSSHCQGGDGCLEYAVLWLAELAGLVAYALLCAVAPFVACLKLKFDFIVKLRVAFFVSILCMAIVFAIAFITLT